MTKQTPIQFIRTTTTGNLPNVTASANLSYIGPGGVAVNMTDFKFYSSNGSATFEVGANITNQNITGNLTIADAIIANGSAGTNGQVLTSNATGGVYFASVAGGVSQVNTDNTYIIGGTITTTGTISASPYLAAAIAAFVQAGFGGI